MTAPDRNDEELDRDDRAREIARTVIIVGIAVGLAVVALVVWEAWVANQATVASTAPQDANRVPTSRARRRSTPPPDQDTQAGASDTAG